MERPQVGMNHTVRYDLAEKRGEVSEGSVRGMFPDHRVVYARAILASLVSAVSIVPLGVWARHLDLTTGHVPLIDHFGRGYWLISLALALLLGALFQLFSRGASYPVEPVPAVGMLRVPARTVPTAWIGPVIVSLSASMLLSIYHSESTLVCVALGVFVSNAINAIARYHLFDNDPGVVDRARGFHTIILHVVAFFALSMIYINKLPSRYSAVFAFFTVVLLLVLITEGEPIDTAHRFVYGLIGGVLLGELTWMLNYWAATGWAGGAILLVFFYLAAGLILAQARQDVQPRDLLEFGGVSVGAFVIVMVSLFR